MVVGVGRAVFSMPENHSLKDKRSIMKSVLAQIQHRFGVSIAEIDLQDRWQVGVIGFSCVSNDVSHADSTLGHIIRFLESARLDAELIDVQTEIVHIW